MVRSKNPDLIFDEILSQRAERITKLYSENPKAGSYGLDRVTLFVTHKCNLKCVYCNGPHMDKAMDPEKRKEMLSSDISLEQYKRLLEDWSGNGLKSIHFTGGEATLHSQLPDFVRLAAEKSISSTLTTNGTAGPELYRALVNNGLSEIRVSIDSANDEEFDQIVRVKNASKRVKQSISSLVDLRDKEGKNIFIILNACVGTFNVDRIRSTLESLIGLQPDDIKFLIIAEQGDEVHSRASRRTVEELLAYAKNQRPDYELLDKKIRALFRKNTFGLTEHTSQYIIKHCFIPLAERTLDSRGIYPCSIYLRYKGAKLADANASFEEQQGAINDFVESHDCRKDEICRYNCTNCCKQLNLAVNSRMRFQSTLKNVLEKGAFQINEISETEISEVLAKHEKIAGLDADDFPFMVIKPYGLAHQDEIKEYLQSQGVKILESKTIESWRDFSLFLYFKKPTPEDVEKRLARNKAYAEFEKGNTAIYLLLEKGIPEKKLARIKSELREWYGEDMGFFSHKEKEHLLKSNCIHSPNYDNLAWENRVVKFFLKNA